jgi:putative transposase
MLEQDDCHTRRASLRLPGFNYSAPRIYFVTIVTLARRKLFLDQRLATAVVECLIGLRLNMGVSLYCYCLMPDHLHLLISTGQSNKGLGQIVGAFKSLSTRQHWEWYSGRLWQRQFFDHIIRNDRDLGETWEYILLNPVRKGLVSCPEDWPYTGSFFGPAF